MLAVVALAAAFVAEVEASLAFVVAVVADVAALDALVAAFVAEVCADVVAVLRAVPSRTMANLVRSGAAVVEMCCTVQK